MSLASMFGIGTGGEDPEAVRQRQESQARQDAAAAQAKQDAINAQMRQTAVGTADQQAQGYFKDRGFDPSQYEPDIQSRIQDLLSTVNPADPAPGQYLRDIGQYVYNQKQDAGRENATRSLGSTFTPDFERGKVSDTFDDPYINQADTAARGTADQYVQNLLKRGVITNTGAAGAEANLDAQGGRVRSQLNDIGQGLISSGRQSLTDVGNRAKNTAGTLNLGQSFDPNQYGSELDKTFQDFSSKFGDQFSGSVPSGLYDTSGLSSAAGVAQGAQNTAFDPQALAGVISKDQQPQVDDPTKKANTALF